MHEVETPAPHAGPRVPVLPEIHSTSSGFDANQTVGSAPPMKPQVYTVSGAGSEVAASPMSEVVDNHSVDIDPFSLTETVGRSRYGEELNRQNGKKAGESGIIKELWSGLMDDLTGSQRQHLNK